MFTKNKKLYEISLYPYRSLNKTDFFILMFALGLISFIAGIIFMLKGAWPVFAFFGLDVLLVYIFFKINFKSGRKKEIIILTKNQLIIEFYDSKKILKKHYLDANWIKINLIKDRKSTRLNSSHALISYAVFCLKKKNNKYNIYTLHYTQTINHLI